MSTDQSLNWFITGCDSGMGYAFAEVALEHGETVVATARDVANLSELATRFGARLIALELDVTRPDQIAGAVAEAERRTGGIDVLVNNAGYGLIGVAEETSPDEYRPLFEVNFFGLAEVTRAVLPGMRSRGRGHILNTSSSGGYAASPGFAFYAATKYAVEGFSDALAQEVAVFGIKVTILEPGSIRTRFAGHALQRPRHPIAAYQSGALKATLDRMNARDGKQPNDPRKVGQALLKIVRMADPPGRLPLGADSLDRLRGKVAAVSGDFERFSEISLSVAFNDE